MALPDSEHISVNGYDIEVFDNHLPQGNVIFAFHWNSGSALSSAQIFNTELAANNRIIAVSLLGHGNSSRSNNPQSEYSIEGIGHGIADIVEHYNLPNYWLVGQSISAHAIMEAHERFERCSGFIAVNAPPISVDTLGDAFVDTPVAPSLFKGQLSGEELKDVAGAFLAYDDGLDTVTDDFSRTDPQFRISLGESVFAGKVRDEIACFKNIAFPVLFLRSDKDSFLNTDYYQKLSTEHELQMQVAVVNDSGHAAFLESVDQCSALIENAIGGAA